MHIKNVHTKRDRVKCKKCPSTFTTGFGARQHERSGLCNSQRMNRLRKNKEVF